MLTRITAYLSQVLASSSSPVTPQQIIIGRAIAMLHSAEERARVRVAQRIGERFVTKVNARGQLGYVTPRRMGGFRDGEPRVFDSKGEAGHIVRGNANAVPMWRFVGWERGHKRYPRQSARALARGTA